MFNGKTEHPFWEQIVTVDNMTRNTYSQSSVKEEAEVHYHLKPFLNKWREQPSCSSRVSDWQEVVLHSLGKCHESSSKSK